MPDTIPALGGAVQLDIYSNGSWTIHAIVPEKRTVTLSQVSGTGNAGVTVQVGANPLAVPDAVILMVDCGEAKEYVYLLQAAAVSK